MAPARTSNVRRIDSHQNAWVRELRAGLHDGTLTNHGRLAVEGSHLVEEAQRSGAAIHAVFLRDGNSHPPIPAADAVFVLPPVVFDRAVTTATPQGIAALVDPPKHGPPDFGVRPHDTKPLIVIAGGLQDPGNLGTLIRSAEAFGAGGMIVLPGTVSRWNQKVLRASSGSSFRLPIWTMKPEDAFSLLHANSVRILAAVARGGLTLERMEHELSGPIALLVGNEGAGLREEWLRQADAKITVQLGGSAESLNAGVAGSILLYEARRQRQNVQTNDPRQRNGSSR